MTKKQKFSFFHIVLDFLVFVGPYTPKILFLKITYFLELLTFYQILQK